MHDQPLSDEDRIARAKRRFRESIIAGLIIGFGFFGLAFLYTLADQRGVFVQLGWRHDQTEAAFPWVIGVLGGVFLIFAVARYWTPKCERKPEFLRKDMDNIHRRWRWVTLILSAASLLNTASFVLKPQNQSAFSGGAIMFPLIVLALIVCFGPGFIRKDYRETLNDELMRSQRARAARLGYFLALAGVAALYFVQRDRPEMVGAVALAVLCAASALPALYFVILDWRSEREV